MSHYPDRNLTRIRQGYKEITMLNFMLANNDFQTWHLADWLAVNTLWFELLGLLRRFNEPRYSFSWDSSVIGGHGPLARYVKLRVAHGPGMPGTFSPLPRVSEPDMHHDTCVTHVPWCMPRSLTSGFLWNGWRGKRSRHSRRKRNPRFCVSGKRPMLLLRSSNTSVYDRQYSQSPQHPRLLT